MHGSLSKKAKGISRDKRITSDRSSFIRKKKNTYIVYNQEEMNYIFRKVDTPKMNIETLISTVNGCLYQMRRAFCNEFPQSSICSETTTTFKEIITSKS